ncbi:hypothetical protein HPB49_000600 [Dermacentor silvarum]|uniref:Uncharacterized protein n=1 Tax=Dermacentor silvarum TaxID=543639 RepID=A0ACB8C6H8_DERSI|nr:uncharacterized protein LOC119461105 [Dermacentor silvarum]KAH7936526.1 hypothetical protein HPB49_000600 [Dermacentor silvarum]
MFSKLHIERQGSKSNSFDALKVETLAKLDEGFESLKFLQRLGEVQMSEPQFSALIQVCNDFLWTKTTIERAFRKYPRGSASNADKRIFREVLILLYKYVTKSVIMLLTQVGIRCPQNATAELGQVLEQLLKSVQSIAHHECLHPTQSKFAVMNVRLLAKPARPKDADVEFIMVMKAMRRELAQRKNTIKASSWLYLMAR